MERRGPRSREAVLRLAQTELAIYSESTTDLKTDAHTRPVGKRPFVELEPPGHFERR
ncbi:hypothetical protein AB4039_05195 [Streptomyces sp. M-16]|uniref:DUF2199 domain-containing protein n=1 Tax=Streptomyces sp. M-16 TaxID=3233040 RepID=UPI003F94BB1E